MRHPSPPPGRPRVRQRSLLVLCVAGVAGLAAVGAIGRVELLRLAATARVVAGGGLLLGREGVHLQQTLHDCGPAALATLLSLEGRPVVPLDSLARLAGTTLAGTTAAGLIDAAGEAGLPLVFRRLPAVPAPRDGFFIAWIRSSHFVVARARADGRVLVFDPQVGRYLLTREGFEGIWSGESLLRAPVSAAALLPSGSDPPARTLATGRLP